MGYISKESVDQIMQRADIVDVVSIFTEVRQRGKEFWCCCPFHREKTPSCKLNRERQGYYCFGCKDHGDVVTFVRKMVNTDYPGALRWLADRFGVQIVEEERGNVTPEVLEARKHAEKRAGLLNDVAAWYHSLLSTAQAVNARNYLAGRGLDADAIEKFKLGYSLDTWDAVIKWGASFGYTIDDLKAVGLLSENDTGGQTRVYDRFRGRLMFPIWNELGKVVGFSARVLEADAKTAKYVNSPETEFFQKGQILYALNFARSNFRDFGYVLVCEGQLDVIACHRAGLVNAVAAQGTAFTEQHARLLRKSVDKAVLSFDADTAGYKAAERTILILHAAGFSVEVVTLPTGEDPDGIFRKGGATALKQVMSVTEDAVHYLFRISCEQVDANSAEGKSIIVNRVLAAVRPIDNLVKRTVYCQWLASKLNLPEHVITSSLNAMAAPHEMQRRAFNQQNERPAVGYGRITSGAAPERYAPPPFVMNEPNLQFWATLFDLTLHFEELAKRLLYMQDVMDGVPKAAIGAALGHLMALTEQEEWENAVTDIQKMDYFADPFVGRAIMASEYADSANELTETTMRAFDDCIARIRSTLISTRIQELQHQLAVEADPEKKRVIYQQINEMIRQKNEIKRQRHF